MWTTLKPKCGGTERKTFAVRRGKTSPRTAVFVVPPGAASGMRVNISVDHSGRRLGFTFSPTGSFVHYRSYQRTKTGFVSIPAQFVAFIPLGTTEASVTYEGDMIVLDLTQFADAVAAAAE